MRHIGAPTAERAERGNNMSRTKGQGSISLRKDGYYVGRIMKDGVTKYFYSKNKKEVQSKLSEYARMVSSGILCKDNRIRFQDYVMSYLYTFKYGHIKDSSFDRIERVFECHVLNSSLGQTKLYYLTDVTIQQFLNEKYVSGLSMSQCRKIFELLRSVLYYAYRKGDITVDYGSLLIFPSADRFKEVKKVDIYTKEECELLYGECLCDYSVYVTRFYRYTPAFVLMLNTGMRAGELLCLEWSDIDFENHIIHINKTLSLVRDRQDYGDNKKHYKHIVQKPKTANSIRDIPMNKKCIRALERLKFNYSQFDCMGKYVVCNVNGDFIRLRSFEKKLKEVCNKCGVKYKGVHALRHTFASQMIDCGVAPKVVSDLLGHSNVTFTLNRYVHTNDNSKFDAVKCLESV